MAGAGATRPTRSPEHPFVAWNAALLKAFFSPAQDGDFVLLALGRDELNDLSPELGGYEGLLDAVRRGPPWLEDETLVADRAPALCSWAESLVRQRRSPQRRPTEYEDPSSYLPYGDLTDRMPTYMPILAALVGVFADASGSFYEESRRQLRLPPSWNSPELGRLNTLWDDLAAWTDETGGRYGRFRPARIGEHQHVGELHGQAIFRSTDIARLAFVFAALNLRPGDLLDVGRRGLLLSALESEPRLSRGLRKAVRTSGYAELIFDRANEALLEWDGSLPRSHPPRHAGGSTEYGVDGELRLELTLHLTANELPWRMGWELRGFPSDVGPCVRHGSRLWSTVIGNARGIVIAPPVTEPSTASVLDELKSAPGAKVGIRVEPSAEGASAATIEVPHKILRRFVYDGVLNCLVERDALPGCGPAYLLVSPDNSRFERVVEAERITVEPVPDEGLPRGWKLWLLADCSRVVGKPLPDGEELQGQPRAIRFVGGVRVRRSGRSLFLPYDLPNVELDAPAGTEIHAEGLELTPEATERDIPEGIHVSSIRRFEVSVVDSRRQHFNVEARKDGALIGSAVLRLATVDVPLSVASPPVGLDAIGATTDAGARVSGMLGLDGLPRNRPGLIPFDAKEHFLGRPNVRELLPQLLNSPEVRFLDFLESRSTGSVPYGIARDHLQEALSLAGRTDPTASVFRELRRRALIEVVTDARGRWIAVARLQPCIWRLPLELDGKAVWGVAGTVGFRHWSALVQHHSSSLLWDRPASGRCPVVRLVDDIDSDATLFERAAQTCATIAEFSVSLDDLRRRLADQGFEQIDARAGDVEAYNPLFACWEPRSDRQHGFDWHLLRYTDPDTGSHRLISLESHLDGKTRFRHVRDERWATWVATAACLEWLERERYCSGVAPWPLPYDARSGDLWLPKRLVPPHLLERALIAASGGPPDEVLLRREAAAEPGEGTSICGVTELGTRCGPFSVCYDPFLPLGEQRTWLRYRWVPSDLARVLAEKLACRVADMSEGET